MKKLAILAAVLFAACDGKPPPTEIGPPRVAAPGATVSFLAAFSSALPCAGQALTFSVREQTPAWVPAVDGGITADGVWTAPSCGSAWLGQTIHVDAKCEASGQSAFASIATVPEVVSGVQIAYAVRLLPLPACLLPDPDLVSAMPPGTQIQFYAKVTTSCGDVVTPTPPATWPAACQ
jgi:hypothetical protein